MARIIDLIAAGQTFSFEFFPPKDEDEQRLLTRTISDLQPLRPSFVSVTYRGGRVSRDIQGYEFAAWVPLIVLILLFGLWPKLLLSLTTPAVQTLLGALS